ncbi:TonB family protein [Neoroseomonas oryzicola]|uniref:Energy transducer TonB n=3 Tax=Neoroseomonas oryzicola TaxID=535904 RepID=A0ABX1ENC7_9PROT|nr:energy transducer TonB [Neoroseomonas oryzicola]
MSTRGPWLVASGVAVLLHVGLAGLLLLTPPIPPSPATPEEVPISVALAEPVAEETPAPAEAPAEQAAAPAEETPPAVEPPPEPVPPEMPPEPDPPPVTEPPPPVEPPPPEPTPEEPPPPEPVPEPAPEPAPRPDPPPQPAPRPRPAPRPAPPRPAAPATTSAPAAAPAATAARPAGPPPSYLQAVAAALERQKRYPEAARARRAMGIALLQFTVARDGRVLRWRVDRSAGDADLDRAVEQMIQRASLPAMPAEMPGDSLTVTVPVRFQIR